MILRIEPANWNPVTERFIDSATAHATLDDIKVQVSNGAKLFKVVNQYVETVAAFVLRIDRFAWGNEGVIVAAGGRAEVDLTMHILPAIECMFNGCKSVRIHTARIGLVKKLAKQNYGGVEYVLRKDL